MIREDRLN